MNQYAFVIERSETSSGAYVPDLPDCIAVARSRAEVERLIAAAMALPIESLQEHGDPVSPPRSEMEWIAPVG